MVSSMKHILLVGLGGGLGSIARYKLSGWVLHQTPGWKVPAGTFVVNVLGCLVAGLLASYVERRDLLGPEARLLLFTGILGGFTTFSAFGLETAYLLRRGETGIALANVVASVIVGIVTLLLAMRVVPAGR
jgi:fluoride exporter